MIIVEIEVPSIEKSYDFKLNDDVSVSVIIEELCAIVCQKEQCRFLNNDGQLMLFKIDNKRLLSMSLSLYENDVKTGDKLLLI